MYGLGESLMISLVKMQLLRQVTGMSIETGTSIPYMTFKMNLTSRYPIP